MPIKLAHNCEGCAKLPLPNSKLNKCWDDKLCPVRLYRWKNRATVNKKQREKARGQSEETVVSNINSAIISTIEIPQLWAAELCLWVDRHNNTIHAIGARLWCGDLLVDRGRIEPIHLLGATEGQLKQVAVKALTALCSAHPNASLSKYRTIHEFDRSECPLSDCKQY